MNLSEVGVMPVLHEVAGAVRGSAWEQGVLVRVAPTPEPPCILADPQRLAQALRNLVVNAVRHTPAGGLVELGAELEGSEVKIFVRDTGVGIPPERVPHVFERFYRGDESRADPPGERHAGLGLAIVEQLASAMHGRVAVASAVGRGTTFTLTFRVVGSSQVV